MNTIDPQFDLTIQRVIHAPRDAVWAAWTRPELLQQWWVPAPMVARIDSLEVSPGGAFLTSLSEDGETFMPHTDGLFIAVEAESRLVFSNAVTSALRPAAPAPVAMVAEISFADHAEGTAYQAVVRHGSIADRELHERLGFFEGWGMVTDALAEVAGRISS